MSINLRKIKNKLLSISGIFKNIFLYRKNDVFYINDSANWVVKHINEKVSSSLNRQFLIKAVTTHSPLGIKNKIIHFGSITIFFKNDGPRYFHPSNKIIVSWHHIIPNYYNTKLIRKYKDDIDRIHTICNATKKQLMDMGVDEHKIFVIPLGIDMELFKQPSVNKRENARKRLGISSDKIVIGSFQKDGVGWGEGIKPKLIKGPDIFLQVVKELARDYPIFVLLVGPARGYVENGLKKLNIPYKSVGYCEKTEDVAQYYSALDLYLITSRIEGGPRAILESWASGVPLVSTRVGLVPDISVDEENILLADVENVNQIVSQAGRIIEDENLKNYLVGNALKEVKKYSWDNIANRYWQELYKNLI